MPQDNAGAKEPPHGLTYKHPPGFRARRGRNWFFLGLTYASYYLCRYNLSIVAPELKKELGLDNSQYGAIQSARDGAYAIGQFVNGLFTDKLGGKQAMTVGAIGTVVLNLLFGLTAWSHFTWLFGALFFIRMCDGYVQAFGAPGMIKINTAWFRREERGGFAGVFGGMIQLGVIGVNSLGRILAAGFTVPLIFFSLTVDDWRYMFIIPSIVVSIVIVLMNIMVKNNPEEAGFRIVHDDEDASEDPNEHIRIGEVFRKITSNKTVWIVAGAYFCTGFVRRAIDSWWVVYMQETLGSTKESGLYTFFLWSIPLTAFIGSFSSGIISDKLFAGRRAPVAMVLYLIQTVCIAFAIAFSLQSGEGYAILSAVVLVLINMACNSTHSILGTAAAMDLGGRKMAGFSSGVIDSFQYYGAMLAGWALGAIIDAAVRSKAPVPTTGPAEVLPGFDATVWYIAMLPFGVLGTCLMGYLWYKNRGKNTRGA